MRGKKAKNTYLIIAGSFVLIIEICLILYIALGIFHGAILTMDFFIRIALMVGVPGISGIILKTLTLNDSRRRSFMKAAEFLLFLFYLLLLFSILFGGIRTLFHSDRVSFAEYFKYNANFIPFKTITAYINFYSNNTINRNTVIENLLGNLLMFVPMGLFLPCLFKNMHKWRNYIITIIILLLGVELTQLILQLGTFDVDDMILNFAGALIMYSIIKIKNVSVLLRKIYMLS